MILSLSTNGNYAQCSFIWEEKSNQDIVGMPGDNHWHTRMDVVPVNWGPMKEGEPIKDAFKDYAKYTFTKKYVENDNRPKFSWTLFIHVTIFSSKDPKCKKFCAKEKGDDVLIVMSMKWGSTTPTPDLGIGY